ncbi:hypothetical protein [Candidatus Poriferisocius sp.]|uniref:hypothetical protein n=1 Tax=Candidatus Poriferisocius sp. TaxID=3101276 RepID=UPI003B59AD34
MKSHHGSARRNLSEDFGIAMATAFLSKVHACREHYNIDAIDNKQGFGIPSKTRPDIGSVTPTGTHILTEAKGRKGRLGLAPQGYGTHTAKIVRDSYLQLTGGGQAKFPSSTRLFLCVTSPIDAGRAMDLEVAEYVIWRRQECPNSYWLDDEDLDFPMIDFLETNWDAIRASWYQRFRNLVGNTEDGVEESGDYLVLDLAGADVRIGLHQRIVDLVSAPDANLGPQLSELLGSLSQDLDGADDGRYPDGTLIRANWPEMEFPDEEDTEDNQ